MVGGGLTMGFERGYQLVRGATLASRTHKLSLLYYSSFHSRTAIHFYVCFFILSDLMPIFILNYPFYNFITYLSSCWGSSRHTYRPLQELYQLYSINYTVLYGIIRYYTVLYWKISGLQRRYNTYSTVITNETATPLRGAVSYQPKSDWDPALVRGIKFSNLLPQTCPTAKAKFWELAELLWLCAIPCKV